ncbi:MAG: MFS transporter [Oscillospiraceae bacterium]|nr:MFS transporter [Oscillospiraceae bacterium]
MNKSAKYKWVMMGLICLGIIVPQYAQFMLTHWGSTWLAERNIAGGAKLAELTTAPLIAGTCLSLASGVLVDRFGLKKLLILCLGITTAATAVRTQVNSYSAMYTCMVLLGITATFFNANQMKLVGRWFPPAQVGIGIGIFTATSNLSMAVGSGVGTLFPNYKSAFVSSAVYTAVVLILWIFLGRERPAVSVRPDEDEKSPPVLECLKVVIRSKKVWFLAVSVMLFQSAALSVSMFMQEALKQNGYSVQWATLLPLTFTLTAAAGCLIIPKPFELIRRPKLAFAVIGVLAAVGLAFAWRIPNVWLSLVSLALLGLITLGMMPVLSALPLTFPEIGQRYAGTAGGFIATLMLAGNVIIPTYITMPLARGDYGMFYLLEGGMMLIFVCLTPFMPVTKKA